MTIAMWKCEMGHVWKKSDGDVCPDCPKSTCEMGHIYYTRQGDTCPKCPKWICSECNHRWYKRDADKCPKCLPKWVCAECNCKWYKKDGNKCPQCPIYFPLDEFKSAFTEFTKNNDAIQYFDTEVGANIRRLFSDGIKEAKTQHKDIQLDEKDEKEEISYDNHLKLGIVCHSVEEYENCLNHVHQALKIQPDFNDAMTTFEEYGYVKWTKDGKSEYVETSIEEIMKNGTDTIKIFDEDNEKEEKEKYDEKFFRENLPYHYSHNFKKKLFEESKIIQCYSMATNYNKCFNMELDFARRACGERELEQYIDRFVYFRIIDEKQINETILRAIIGIDNDQHIKRIFERLQKRADYNHKHIYPEMKKVDEIAEEMKKYNDNLYEIHNRSHKVKQLIVILDSEVSKITQKGKKLKNQKQINEFINEMNRDNDKIEQLLASIKEKKYFEKLGGLRSFIELVKDIKSMTLIDENSEFYKLLDKSWSKICNVHATAYLYRITHETKKHLKCVSQSFGFLAYVTDKKIEQYVESLQKAKDCGFDKETEQYFELFDKQTKLRKEIKSKQSSFLSMANKFVSILNNQYYRDRLLMENEMKNVQCKTITAELTLWSVQHEKQKQQQKNVKNHMEKRIDVWNKYMQPNITAEINKMIQQQQMNNDKIEPLLASIKRDIKLHIDAILPGDDDKKLKEKFLDLFFISSLMKNRQKLNPM
eukprot:150265_1